MAKILLIEDDGALRRALAEYLRHLGHGVEATDEAPEACSILARQAVDLVVTDVQIPGSGFSILEWIRLHRPQTPVIMITGRPQPGGKEVARCRGAFRYLVKPISGSDLGEAVRNALAARGDGELGADGQAWEARD